MIRSSDSDCIEKIEDSIRDQLERLGSSVAEAQGQSNVRWSRSSYKDSWDGLPGYESEFGLLHFSSEQYPNVGEVTDIIRGELLSSVAALRRTKFDQDPSNHDFGQPRQFRSYTWEAIPGEPKIVGKVLSLQYSVHSYTGGAHGNMHFLPFCFLLDPLVPIQRLNSVFGDENKALEVIRSFARKQLLGRTDEENSLEGQEETVLAGTEDWDSFECFGFDKEGLELSFSPYQVAAYGYGPQFVQMPYVEFESLMKPWARHALDL